MQIHPEDASYLGVIDQALIWISSRRGKVIARASVTERANRGAVYMTYQWWIGACNELTVDHVDPVSKTPELNIVRLRSRRLAIKLRQSNMLSNNTAS